MAILFSEIFDRAVYLFDDPDIRQEYADDPVTFQMDMRPLLINGAQQFTHPIVIADMLCDYSDDEGASESYDYVSADVTDGSAPISYSSSTGTYTFRLGTDSANTPVSGAVFSVRVNGNLATDVRYDEATNAVLFSYDSGMSDGDNVVVYWYYAGAFTDDFSNIGFRGDYNVKGIVTKIINILATSVAVEWSFNEMNRALEIRNILSNSDMQFYSPANSAQAKVEWHKAVQREMDSLETQLNWRIHATPVGGSNFGK